MEPSKELKQAVIDYKNGKEEAFTTLYEESQKYIYVCISKIMKDCDNLPDVVSDLMQDTYVEISRHISQLEHEESFLNWAGTIATRQCYAYLKKNRQYVLVSEEDDVLEELAADEELIPETLMQDREKQRLIRKIIDTELTPIQRLCVTAYYYNEQKQSEIASDLGIPENTVKTHLSRAKAKIREGVLELEKKEGIKLYTAAPFLLLLLGQEIRECVVPAEITKMVLSAANAGAVSTVGAGAKAAAAAGKGGAKAAAAAEKGGSTTAVAGKGGTTSSGKAGAPAAGKGSAAAVGKTGVAAALKVKIAAAVVGVGALTAVGGILLSHNNQSETPDEIQVQYVEGKKTETFMGYQFQYPESAELEPDGGGYSFRYQTDIAVLVQVPADTLLFAQNLTDLKEAPAACEQYVFDELETTVSEFFDTDTTTQTVTASEVRTINGIEMLRVEGFFTNTQKERDVDFVGYYFFTEVTPAFATFSTPYYVIGIPLDDGADAASFMDEFAEGIMKSHNGGTDMAGDFGGQSNIENSPETEKWETEEPIAEGSDPTVGIVEPPAEDFVYEYDAALEGIVITKYNGEAKAIRFPSHIDGYTVKAVRIFANYWVTQVELPDSIVACSFRAWDKLTEITIPDGVTCIEESAFSDCSSLTGITIPDSVTTIEDTAFYSCKALTSITLPESVTTIDVGAFYDCSSLSSITIPKARFIENSAFYGCSSLTDITLPDGVRSIGSRMFSGCNSLTSIILPDSVREIYEYAFADCSNLTSITIPDRVTFIGAYAFSGCSSLTSLTIPDNVTEIGHSAFYNCENLKVTYQGQEYTMDNDPGDWWQLK